MRPSLVLALAALICVAPPCFAKGKAQDTQNQEEFRQSLVELLDRTEKSIKLLREQILASQSAPFLADLYLQLGELLATKASALYYIQMEREGKTENLELSAGKSSPIVEAQREAIEIYLRVIKDFPKFPKRVKVYYLLAASLKAIDDNTRFILMTEKMASEFPKAQETARARLLLGQTYFDQALFPDAKKVLVPVMQSSFPYERNMAKHRVALVLLAEEKPEQSLKLLEQVIQAKDYKDEESPMEVSLKTRQVKSSLRREALIDSVRAYTGVYTSDSDPVAYYAKIAPDEILFTEVLEKLAFRLVSLKRFDEAIRLMRTLSNRTLDPQKVVNMYREVLKAIPIKDRVQIAPEEMRHVLQRLSKWLTYYEIASDTMRQAETFFETQVRDLATRSHAFAKAEKDTKKVEYYMDRARRYYQLYLAHFRGTTERAKIALNLADVLYAQKRYPESADYYLRVFSGEFGKGPERKDLIENAVATAQKSGDYSYYEQLRIRGILIRAIKAYMDFAPRMANDPKLNFLLLKTRFEQGFYDDTLQKLFQFVERNPRSRYATYAAELVLDYYNTRKDYAGLMQASDRFVRIPGAQAELITKVNGIRNQAAIKLVDQQVKQSGDFNQFEQGKSYLESAYSLEDETLKNAALQKALARSKEEADVGTFFETAKALAKTEKDPAKRAQILLSMSKEQSRLTNYYESLEILRGIYSDGQMPAQDRANSLSEAAELALLLRDFEKVGELAEEQAWSGVREGTKKKIRDQLTNLLESPVSVPEGVLNEASRGQIGDALLLALYKAQTRIGGSALGRMKAQVQSLCGGQPVATVCKWEMLRRMEAQGNELGGSLQRAPASVQGVEGNAKAFGSTMEKFRVLENSGDVQLDLAVSLKQYALYRAFASYLNRVAEATPDLKDVLAAKTKESVDSANQQIARCRRLAAKSQAITPAHRFCASGENAPVEAMLTWEGAVSSSGRRGSAKGVLGELEKPLFAAKDTGEPLLKAAEKYLSAGYYHHAAAAASLGSVLSPGRGGDFKAVLGCSLKEMGLWSEANFHLKSASGYQGLAPKCLQSLTQVKEQS